ncbi:MAG: FHA domain-containing protein [Planctomycetota bacterium]
MRLIYRRGREEIAFPIDEGETFIGRKEYCEIHFPDGSLSKRHARLVRRGGALKVFDAGSRNGTRVNGERIAEAVLHNGDELECGKVMFRVDGLPAAASRGGGDAEFEVLDDDDDSGPVAQRSAARTRSQAHSRGSMLVTARAVASTDARPSMLDVLPELPPSTEQAGYVPEGPRAKLRLVDGGPARDWELGEETITIGSKEENTVVLSGEGVSRYHAEIVFEDGGWSVKDLGARNGIFVAGEKVDVYELKDGDEVQIGTCRLRFTLVKPDPFAEVKAVLRAFREDPKGTLQRDPRARIGLVATIVLFLLVLLSFPGTRNVVLPPSQTSEVADWLKDGTQALIDGKYLEARNIFLKAKAHVSTAEQRVPNLLERIAALWMSLEKGPASFRWDKADNLLKDSTRIKNLPKELQDWRAKQFDFVEKNKAALTLVQEAEGVARQGDDAAARPDIDAAAQFYDQATSKAGQIPRDSLFVGRSDKLVESVRQSAFRMLLREANRVTRQTPDWVKGLKLLKRAADYAASPDDRGKLRTLADRFDRNRRDEVSYMRAVEIIRNREVERYPTAREQLESINPRSRVYPDGRAYLEWIEADLAVRAAKRAYDLGQARRAFQLLSDALNHDVLGEDAIDSVKRRHTAWSRVVRAWDRGMEHKAAGEFKEARKEFEFVLENEKNGQNSFNHRARLEIKSIDTIIAGTYERKVGEMKSALRDQKWGEVHLWALEVQKDRNHKASDLAFLRHEVAEANKKYRLYKRASRQFLADNEDEFPKMAEVLRMLTSWLPDDDKDKLESKKLLEKVLPRLRNWIKNARGER